MFARNISTASLLVVATAVVPLAGSGTTPAAAACPLPTVSVTGTNQYEGSGGGRTSFGFTVRVTSKDQGCSGAGSVRYRTLGGGAEAESDFVPTSGTLSWKAPGTFTVPVPVARDSMPEFDEDFSLTLFEPRNAVIAESTASVTVFNDDKLGEKDFPGVEIAMPTGGICWWPEDYVKLPLWVNVVPRAPITVELYTKDGTAVAGKHYELGQSTITFPTQTTKVELPIKILQGPGDPKQELVFYVGIKDVSAGVAVNQTAKIVIRQR